MNPLRRLDDPTTYWGLSIRQWLSLTAVLVTLYLLVTVVHVPIKPLISVTMVLGGAAAVLLGQASRQALGAGHYLRAVVQHRRNRSRVYSHPADAELVTTHVRLRRAPEVLADQGVQWEPATDETLEAIEAI